MQRVLATSLNVKSMELMDEIDVDTDDDEDEDEEDTGASNKESEHDEF